MRTVCVDASVAVQWITCAEEPHHSLAQCLLAEWKEAGTRIVAPPVFDSEVRRVLLKRQGKGLLDRHTAWKGVAFLRATVLKVDHPDIEYYASEFQRHLASNDTSDTMYLALAAIEKCEYWTDDMKLFDKMSRKFKFIRWLGEYEPRSTLSFCLPEMVSDDVASKELETICQMTYLDPNHPTNIPNVFVIIPGIWGDGSNGSPDYIDREHTTAFIDPVNHRIG